MKRLTLILIITFSGVFFVKAQDHPEDRKGVEDACYNYINAFYKADTTLAYKSVHKNVRKVGFYFKEEEGNYTDELEMPFDELVSLAKRWNADGKRADESTAKEVEIFEISDKTAVAKVSAVWGIDYISLAKMEGQWMIINVLWQSPPKYSVN